MKMQGNIRRRNFTIGFILLLFLSFGQRFSSKVDSFKFEISNAASDTDRMDVQVEYAYLLINIGEYDAAKKVLQDILLRAVKNKSQIHYACAKLYFGLMDVNQGNYISALDKSEEALRIFRKLPFQTWEAQANSNIGNIYAELKKYDKALLYQKRALKIRQQLNLSRHIAASYINLGGIALQMDSISEAKGYYLKALEVFNGEGYASGIAAAYENLASVSVAENKNDEAIELIQKAIVLRKRLRSAQGLSFSLYTLARAEINVGKLNNAYQDLNESYSQAVLIGHKGLLADISRLKYKIDSIRHDKNSELANFRLYIAYRDSLRSDETEKKLLQIKMQNEFDRETEKQQLLQQKKDEVAAQESKRKNAIIWLISVFGAMVLLLAFFAFKSFLHKKKAHSEILAQKQVIEEKQKEIIDSILYAKRIQRSLLPTEKYVENRINRLKNTN